MSTRTSTFISKSIVVVRVVVAIAMVATLSGCMMPFLMQLDKHSDGTAEGTEEETERDNETDTELPLHMVTVRSDQFKLAWDPPDPSTSVTAYHLYYREHGTADWFSLGAVSGDQLSLDVSSSNLADGPGMYDFAVQSVDADGAGSDYHTSTSSTAQPETGWYVNWQPET